MSECGFCHGKPVGDAATWLDGKPRPPALCPRCGETHYDPVWVMMLLEIAEAAARLQSGMDSESDSSPRVTAEEVRELRDALVRFEKVVSGS